MQSETGTMEKIVALCRRRGFIFGSSEIYGGIGGFWDYGPLGTELKRNVKGAWWNDMVRNPPLGPGGVEFQMVGVDCSIIMNPKVWEASGHIGGFSDSMVDCRECGRRFRVDVPLQAVQCSCSDGVPSVPAFCPSCGGELTESRDFNLMFDSHAGAIKDDANKVYLRPETAQGVFVNFKNVIDTSRVRLPFGIAQIGKAFRNEINPRNFTFRSREFEQMEIEFFCHPEEADQWYLFWRDLRYKWYTEMGLKSDKLHLRDHEPDELAHYAKGCADVEYDFPFGLSELEGVANRADFDLNAHKTASGKDLSYFDRSRGDKGECCIPYVIEPSAGVDRFILAVICEAYSYDESRASKEVMKFHPRLAPIKAAVFPLVAKGGMPEIAEPIYREVKKHYPCQYDVKQAIGKRYARMDEAGTPFCFTVDGQTADDDTVTVRNRDDASQERIDKSRCVEYLRDCGVTG